MILSTRLLVPENVVKYLQDFTDAAMKRMNGEFFEIDPRIAICEARLST